MEIEIFLAHHGLMENPFDAEEARHDHVFARMNEASPEHPDFAKILGQFDPPSTSIVFGEKGSGKTAIRLQIDRRFIIYNQSNPDRQSMLVVYDDLNPFLDRILSKLRRKFGRNATIEKLLDQLRLEDHQDAILSLAITQLVDRITDKVTKAAAGTPPRFDSRVRKLPHRLRANLAVLAALYDQPQSGPTLHRWRKLVSRLRLSWLRSMAIMSYSGCALLIIAMGLTVAQLIAPDSIKPWGMPALGASAAGTLLLMVLWVVYHARLWLLTRRVIHQMPAIERAPAELRRMFLELPRKDLKRQSWPIAVDDARNQRYVLTARLTEILQSLGFSGCIVVIDRVDEPTAVSGKPDRMRSLIWPMLDNKFLQQDRIGFKMLLPIELRYLLHRESADFFQEARLDKQHLIDRLTWSGATLYDLCSSRLRACLNNKTENPIALMDLFEEDVSAETIIDALDQMHQPRDAFKFLYNLIQEHCRMVPQDKATFRIPKLTLDTVRRIQADRVQELYRGLAPA